MPTYSLSDSARVRSMLRLACAACGRRGQYRIDRLLERFGPDMTLPTCGTTWRNARVAAQRLSPAKSNTWGSRAKIEMRGR